MNALLRIQVQVAAREAQAQLRTLQASISALNRSTGAGGSAARLTAGTDALGKSTKGVNSELTALGRLSQRINGTIDRSAMGMIQLGKNMQWVGRQINFNFTIPLILAGRAIMGWELDAQRAFTRLRKVYGDYGVDYTNELKQIGQGLRLLSDYYGVQIDQVNELGAQWAAAGLKGAALLDAVKASIDVSILGDYQDLGDVFKQLVVIMGAYNLKASQLTLVTAKLNTVENMTAAQFPDLIAGLSRAGAAANTAGVDIDHLAAMIAVLTPATGTATQAGNSLRTMFSRLMAPTQDTVDILKQVGINYYDMAFQQLNGAQRLELIATKWQTLTDAQKANLASVVASRWQFNRFSELMDDMNNKQGTYRKVLEALNKSLDLQNMNEATKEIQTLLKSDPRQLQIVTNAIKNLLMDAIVPAIPVLINILGYIKALFQWFSNLPKGAQKAAIGILLLVSAVGIAAQLLGSFKLLFGTFIDFIIWIAQLIPGVSLTASAQAQAAAATTAAAATEMTAATTEMAASTAANGTAIATAFAGLTASIEAGVAQILASLAALGPVGSAEVLAAGTEMSAAIAAAGGEMAVATAAAEAEVAAGAVAIPAAIGAGWIALIAALVAAVIAVIIIFRKQIWAGIKAAVDGVWKGLSVLPKIFMSALEGVIHVVTGAVKIIIHWLSYLNPFARHSPSLVDNVTAGVDAILNQYARLSNIGQIFRQAAADMAMFTAATKAANDAAAAQTRSEQRQSILSVSPDAGPATDAMYSNLDQLKTLLGPLNDAIAKQRDVVKGLQDQYDAAGRAIDAFDAALEPLRNLVDSLNQQIDDAKAKIQEYANTNIIGMKAANDAIFDNEMAQKRLRLELLKMEDAGKGYDDIRKKIEFLNGDIEKIQGEMTSLQQAGAGSDVLNVYKDQLNSLYAQRDSLTEAQKNSADLTKQLEDLQRQGEILDLEKSLNFDPLLKQIDDLANAQKEMSFDDIIKGITDEKSRVADLTAQYDAAKTSLDSQEQTLKDMKDARDALKVSLDAEQATLDTLNQTYSDVEDNIRAIEQALSDAASAAELLTKAMGGGGAGGGGPGFSDLTGDYEDLQQALDDSSGSIQEWLDKMQKLFGNIKIDPFGFLKKGWHIFQDWWNKTAWPWLSKIPGNLVHWLDTGWDAVWDFFVKLPGRLASYFNTAWDWLYEGGVNIGKGLLQGIGDIAAGVLQWFIDLPGTLAGYFVDAINWLIPDGSDIINGLLKGLELAIEGVFFFFVQLPLKILLLLDSAAQWLVGTGLKLIGGLLQGIIDAAPGIWNWFLDLPGKLLTFFGNVLSWLWDNGKKVVTGMLNGIKTAAVDVWNWFLDLPGKIVGWVGDALQWLWQKGWDIIQGAYNGIVDSAVNIWNWLTTLPNQILDKIGDVGKWLYDVGKKIMNGLWDGMKSVWDHITGWLSTLNPANWKGPPARDSKMLYDSGRLIMQGLRKGMQLEWANTTAWLSSLDPSRALNTNVQMLGGTSAQMLGGSSNSKTVIFNGDLSFPNISDPMDADRFIANLEALAGSSV